MRNFLVVAVLLVSSVSLQAQTPAPDPNAKVKDELRTLFAKLGEAFQKRDRTALESIYAEEFQFVHASGFADTRTVHLDEALAAPGVPPAVVPPMDGLQVYGDVAILRATIPARRGGGSTFSTSVFAKKAGKWQIIHMQGTLAASIPPAVKIDPKQLDIYVGKYQADADDLSFVRDGDNFYLLSTRFSRRTLTPTGERKFYDKLGDEFTFFLSAEGKVTHVDIRLANGIVRSWKRTE